MRSYLVGASILGVALTALAADAPSTSGIDLKAMDTSIAPCENFYQYACGGWKKANPIPADQSRWGRFQELKERNLEMERTILEKASHPSANRTEVEQKIGDYYASCMDEKGIEAAGLRPIRRMLDAIAGLQSKKDLTAEVSRLHEDGVDAFFGFFARPDQKDSAIEIANVGQGGLGLPDRDYYLKTEPRFAELRKQYEETVGKMLGMLGGRGYDAAAVMRIETALAKASLDRVALRNPDNTYHKMTVAELEALSPEFDFHQYLARVPKFGSLNVSEPDFVKGMNAVIAASSLEDLKTYLVWHVLASYAELLPKAYRDAAFAFYGKTLRGQKEQQVRWKQCVNATDDALGDALGEKFVEAAFSGTSKQRALALVGEIEKSMAKDIEEAHWMTSATKDQALTKLHRVTNKIGYPDKWKNYSSVKIERGDYFGNSVRAAKFEIRRNLAKIGKATDKSEWGMTPPTVNAYYSPPMNNINFPAGILQPPFYNPKADDAVNLGAIGVVIGHELTHGFDDQGRRFDGKGNLRDWWTAADAKAFEERAECFVKEYEGFSPVPGVHLNGKLTLGENAADNGGIHLAYMALLRALEKQMLTKADGFTPQQRFFLGFAQIWCENSTEESARLRAMTDPHSPGEFRVNGVVRNMRAFREAFSCKAGEPMVPANSCRIW
ncbi:MAG: M13 family metallopeptidase [Bryobacterales bacterium]|nr:M13 family metallopeptidase [Bryobacterales bacterium]